MSDPDAEVTIDEYMVACYGTTEYPEDMTSVVLKCEGADEKTIHYAYKCAVKSWQEQPQSAL